MFTFSKLITLLKILKEPCNKCLKHKSVKKAVTQENKYTNTVLLPKTDFPLWLSGSRRVEQDEKIMKECGFASLYNWQREHVTGREYVLHDGPPYANGMPHMGHAINKILKDITIRQKLLQGHKIHYKPGWDCHGLPIELKAMAGQDVMSLAPLAIRDKARRFAKETIRDHKAVFRSWGLMADWENGCYYTYDKSYVKNQIQQFYKLYERGLIYRDVKPVFWSPSSRTALAEAELKYNENHVSTSTYLRIRVTNAPAAWGEVYALVWTTTPWTLPANQAIAFNPTLPYSLVDLQGGEERYIISTQLIDQVATTLGKKIAVICDVDGTQLSSLHYEHPLDESQTLPMLPAEYVLADKGTGLVHTTPAHGPDDFKLAKKFNLPVLCLVDEQGCYMPDAGPELSGQPVLTSGTASVLKLCRARGTLLYSNTFKHSYPYDWRTNQPVILRASPQWFFDTTAVKEKAVAALGEVSVLPERGVAGLLGQVQTRLFWCISRQRAWGVPIPVLYTSNGQPLISRELVDHYCHLLETTGDDFWWSCSLSELAPPHLLSHLNVDHSDIQRGQDILDIWMDSGLSWSAVLEAPADLYLEGVDQFNGWFQASLMTSVALQEVPPYKTLFVHGFAVDEAGLKMSKSIGNVVNPQDILYGGPNTKLQPTYGQDTLRWWVAAHACHQTNVPVSSTTLSDSRSSVQKLRALMRYLLGAVYALPLPEEPRSLQYLDRYLLHCLLSLDTQVRDLYNQFMYNHVCSTLTHFAANHLSALYCHLTKDRLYCDAEDSDRRRAVQTTLYHTLNVLTRLVAPVLPVLAEEVYRYQPYTECESLFHTAGPVTRPEWHNPEVETVIQLALEVKQQVNTLSPLNCNNWQLSAVVCAPSNQYQLLKALQDTEVSSESELAEILQLSQVTLRPTDGPELQVEVGLVGLLGLARCERCRRHTAPAPDVLCPRCKDVLR